MTADLIARYDVRLPRYTSYPTAPHFHAGVDAGTCRGWLGELDPALPLSLYLHVPFCRRLCWYCGCHMKVARTEGPLAAYVDALMAEIETVADALPGRFAVSHLHWGGGTPTILPPDLMRAVDAVLRRRFALAGDAEIAVEADPRGLNGERLATLAAMGVNRVSLGLQDLDPGVQSAIGREQPYELVERVVRQLRAAGIAALSFDLMYGLPRQTTASLLATVESALSLSPSRVSLFGYAHVPWLKRHQRILEREPLPAAAARLAMAEAAAGRLEQGGYVRIGLDHFAHPADAMAVAKREGRLRRNFQGYTTDTAETLIGFGASAIGALPQGYVQNVTDIDLYRTSVERQGLAVARGLALDDEDRARREAIMRVMCDLTVDAGAVALRHGLAEDAFDAALEGAAGLLADGLVRLDGRTLGVTGAGRPFVRAAAALFDSRLDPSSERHARAL